MYCLRWSVRTRAWSEAAPKVLQAISVSISSTSSTLIQPWVGCRGVGGGGEAAPGDKGSDRRGEWCDAGNGVGDKREGGSEEDSATITAVSTSYHTDESLCSICRRRCWC